MTKSANTTAQSSNNKTPLNFKNIQIQVQISGDDEIKKLNKKYLKKDYTTDVLSFNINDILEDGTLYLGDLIVNKDQARRQAKDYGNTIEEEISELISHGVMHLLGKHHEGDNH